MIVQLSGSNSSCMGINPILETRLINVIQFVIRLVNVIRFEILIAIAAVCIDAVVYGDLPASRESVHRRIFYTGREGHAFQRAAALKGALSNFEQAIGEIDSCPLLTILKGVAFNARDRFGQADAPIRTRGRTVYQNGFVVDQYHVFKPCASSKCPRLDMRGWRRYMDFFQINAFTERKSLDPAHAFGYDHISNRNSGRTIKQNRPVVREDHPVKVAATIKGPLPDFRPGIHDLDAGQAAAVLECFLANFPCTFRDHDAFQLFAIT